MKLEYKSLSLSRDRNSTNPTVAQHTQSVPSSSIQFQPFGNLRSTHSFTHPWFLKSCLARPARQTNRLGLDTTQGLRTSTGSGPRASGHSRISLPSRAAIPFLLLRLHVISPGTASLAPGFGLTPPHQPSDSLFRPPQGSVQPLPYSPHSGPQPGPTAARRPPQTNPGCSGNRFRWQFSKSPR
jgi:hypothetical protein